MAKTLATGTRGRWIATAIASMLLVFTVSAEAESLWKKTYAPDRVVASFLESEQRFKAAQTKAIDGDSIKILDYVQTGITMSDLSCEAWLDTLGRSDRDTSLFKDLLNIVGNVILGISGINGASSSSLARGALFLGASNATIDAYRNEILLGTVSDIEDKVKDGRRVSAAYFVAHIPGHFDEAKRRLIEYHNGCSPNAIKVLLKTSLAQVKYVAPDVTLATSTAQAQADVYASDLYKLMFKAGEPAPSDETLYRLYATQIAYPADSSDVIKNMKADANVIGLSKIFQTNKDVLAAFLGRIGELRGYKKRIDAELVKEKSDKAEFAAAAIKANAQAEVNTAKKEVEDALIAAEIAKTQVGVTTSSDKPLPEKSSAENLISKFSSQIKPQSFPFPSVLVIEGVKQEAGAHAIMFSSQAAVDLKVKLEMLAKKTRAYEDALANERALRSVPPGAATASFSPASISAVLVPINK